MNQSKSENKNDIAWKALFKQHNILNTINNEGIYRISATAINQLREARLMTKFDHKVNLPSIFKDHHLTILPDSRGTYLVGRFDAYHQSPTKSLPVITEIPFPANIETIDYKNLYSESAALLCAYNTGIIADILDEDVKLTVFGRMSTSQFDFYIRQNQGETLFSVSVNNAQCEIDGGFEGDTKFAIVEAKNYQIDDFLIRQLYYPYRLWKQKTSKAIVPIFMTYSNDVFTFCVYEFAKEDEYNSIKLIKQQSFQIAPERIKLDDIYSIYDSIKLIQEPMNVPFPQADNFSRVIDLLGLLYSNDLSQQDITSRYQFASRQTQYYADAAIYLGLVEKQEDKTASVGYKLSPVGKMILEKAPKQKNLAIVKQILSYKVFNLSLGQYFDTGERPTKETIVKIMSDAGINIGNGTTKPRRAQTVLAWIDWILRLCQID